MLTQARLKELLHYDPDTGVFTNRVDRATLARAGDVAGSIKPSGYIIICIAGKNYRAHRLAFLYMNGHFPPDMTDHINGIRCDNRWENLRAVSHAENCRNKALSKDSRTGLHGVRLTPSRKRYRADIKQNGKCHVLGYFTDFFEACCARKSAELDYDFHSQHGSTRARYL